jgi:hypothetical protein
LNAPDLFAATVGGQRRNWIGSQAATGLRKVRIPAETSPSIKVSCHGQSKLYRCVAGRWAEVGQLYPPGVPATTITFSFPATIPFYYDSTSTEGANRSSIQCDAATGRPRILQKYSGDPNITFKEVQASAP